MAADHLFRFVAYVEDVTVDANGEELFDDDGEYLYSGTLRAVKVGYLKRQRVFRSSGSQGTAGERVSNHELMSSEEILESSRVWLPGADQTDVDASLTPIGLEAMARPYGGLKLYHTFL